MRVASKGEGIDLLILHGGGKACADRYLNLAEKLAEAGFRVHLMDHRGHGRTRGELLGQTLEARAEEVALVREKLSLNPEELVVIAFSMGAFPAIDLAKNHPDLMGIVLCAPAAYGESARRVPFGPQFTRTISRPFSWRGSPMFQDCTEYGGTLCLVFAELDEVIPTEVSEEYLRIWWRKKGRGFLLRLGGAPHQLGSWFAANYADRDLFVSMIEGMFGSRSPA